MKCLILAGGFATRLYPLTLNKAKALLEYKGKPVISHLIERVPGNIETYVSTNRKFLADFLDWQRSLDRKVTICIEDALTDAEKKGAISAIDYWIKTRKIDEDLLVLAGDNYFDMDLSGMIAKFTGKNPLIAVYDVEDREKACEIGKACQVGLVTLQRNKVTHFDEKPDVPTSSIIATGIYILPTKIFPILSQYCQEKKRDNLGSFISYLLSQTTIRAYPMAGTWIDIGDQIKKGTISLQPIN
jgi:glucose-1-phosphate thymidylyltransferase